MECDADLFEWPGKEDGKKGHEGDTALFRSPTGKYARHLDMILAEDHHMIAQQVMAMRPFDGHEARRLVILRGPREQI